MVKRVAHGWFEIINPITLNCKTQNPITKILLQKARILGLEYYIKEQSSYYTVHQLTASRSKTGLTTFEETIRI